MVIRYHLTDDTVAFDFVFFSQDAPETKNWAKFGSRDNTYCKFWHQLSKELTVSTLVSNHCLGALGEAIIGTTINS